MSSFSRLDKNPWVETMREPLLAFAGCLLGVGLALLIVTLYESTQAGQKANTPTLSYGQPFALVTVPLSLLAGLLLGLVVAKVSRKTRPSSGLVTALAALTCMLFWMLSADVARYGFAVTQLLLYAVPVTLALCGLVLVVAQRFRQHAAS